MTTDHDTDVSRPRVLLVGGTVSQTKQMLAIGTALEECDVSFTPFYADGLLQKAADRGWLNFTAMGGRLRERSLQCLRDAGVHIDDGGRSHVYDLVVLCTDLVLPRNVRGRRSVLVQEGLTEPEGALYLGVRYLGLPRVLANTAAFGLSDAYDAFCVASPGYRDVFLRKGVRPEKLVVTGLPMFDQLASLRENDFPLRDFALICTSNARETFKYDNREWFLRRAVALAGDRPLIVKLHPGERHDRATAEVRRIAPHATILTEGNTEHMVANAAMVITQYSTVALTAAALDKEVHSYLDPDLVRRVVPPSTDGRSAGRIADVCRSVLKKEPVSPMAVQRLPGEGAPRFSQVHLLR